VLFEITPKNKTNSKAIIERALRRKHTRGKTGISGLFMCVVLGVWGVERVVSIIEQVL
jgi:hypothetical protein